MISHERSELIKFLNTEDGAKVAKYLTRADKLLKDIERFYEYGLDMDKLVSTFQKGSDEDIEVTRDFLDKYFDMRGGKMPAHNIPLSVRRSATALEAKDNFKEGMHSLTRGSVTKGTIDLFAAALSASGLTVRERQLFMTLLSTSAATTLISMATSTQANATQHDVRSTMNSFNASVYSQSMDPLKIIIEADQTVRHYDGGYMFSPYLIQKLQDDPSTHQYMNWIIDAAGANGLDPVLFANQMFRESIHFNKDVVSGEKISPAGAMGIAQFMRATGKTYGLTEDADFFDPKKSIYAAARYMSDLTADYDGDQILAMVTYNGGPNAVKSAREQLGKDSITGDEWVYAMNIRHAQFGDKVRSAWHVETREYIGDITAKNWDTQYKNWAQNLQGDEPLLFVEDLIRGNSAVAAIYQASPSIN